jgi:hypothetical protein
MERTPLDIVRDVYDAFARQDLDAVLELVDPAIVVTQDPALPWGGHYVGREGFGEFAVARLPHRLGRDGGVDVPSRRRRRAARSHGWDDPNHRHRVRHPGVPHLDGAPC